METVPRLKVSSDRLVKPGIEPASPGLQGKRFIHYTTAAPQNTVKRVGGPDIVVFFCFFVFYEFYRGPCEPPE